MTLYELFFNLKHRDRAFSFAGSSPFPPTRLQCLQLGCLKSVYSFIYILKTKRESSIFHPKCLEWTSWWKLMFSPHSEPSWKQAPRAPCRSPTWIIATQKPELPFASPRVCTGTALSQKWRRLDSNQAHQYGMWACQVAAQLAAPQHLPIPWTFWKLHIHIFPPTLNLNP